MPSGIAKRQHGSSRASSSSGCDLKLREFYIMTSTIKTRSIGYRLLNSQTLFAGGPSIFMPPAGQRGFRDYPETPVFRLKGKSIPDFEEYSFYWFISNRMRVILEGVDPQAFAFLKCRVQLPDGTDAPFRWLCDVVRVLDALDEEKSKIRINAATDGSKFYGLSGGEDLIFNDDAVGPHHIFRMMYFDARVICDERMKRACKTEDLSGLRFVEPAKY
jgi:hypothetical protein